MVQEAQEAQEAQEEGEAVQEGRPLHPSFRPLNVSFSVLLASQRTILWRWLASALELSVSFLNGR